jgi:hypothetical protein
MIRQPVDLLGNHLPMDGMRMCISGAVPERQFWGAIPDLDRLILGFVSQLSGLIVRYGGQIVHGSQPSLTPIVSDEASRQRREDRVALKLFASQLFGQLPEVTAKAALAARAEVVLTEKIGSGDVHDADTRNHSLTAMRLTMMQDTDVVVAVGGKLHADTGYNPGVLEELAQARWHEIPCFVIGAFSGASASLDNPILEELSAGNGFENKSSMVEMATWTEAMDEYSGKLISHLIRHAAEFRQREHSTRLAPELEFRSVMEKSVAASSMGAMTEVHVDPKVTSAWLNRFLELRERIEKKDIDGARNLLQRPPSASANLLEAT